MRSSGSIDGARAVKFLEEPLPGTFRISLKHSADDRGVFVKTFARTAYEAQRIPFDFREEFYSVSRKNVIRGMHFQLPPHDHDKIVFCPVGAVEDVLLDLRAGSSYGAVRSFILRADEPEALFIPTGIAHGFKSLANGSLVVYKTSAEYAPEHDAGISWDSFGYDWKLDAPIMSARDRKHQSFGSFSSPF